jgi:hypothetical protein
LALDISTLRPVRGQAHCHCERAMNWNGRIRQLHRWTSIAFTATVIANFVQIARGGGNPLNWVTYSPLVPLAVLLLTGLYLFALPYLSARRL